MTRGITRTFILTAAVAVLVAGTPAAASAQRVQVEARVSPDVRQDLREALREVTSSIAAAIRDISSDLSKELGHIDRDVNRDVAKGLSDGLRGLSALANAGTWNQGGERNWNSKADDRQTRTLAIGASGTMEINNLSGDVKVTAGSGRDAGVEIIRHARGRTDADARLGLERVKVDVQVTGSRAVVKSDYPNERQSPYSVSIDIIVSAPAGTRLTINGVSGDILVSGIKGDLTVKTVSGDIVLSNVGAVSEAKTASGDLTITGAATDGSLDVGTLNGDLRLQNVKARRLTAGTVSGDVVLTDVSAETVEMNTMSGDAVFSGTLAPNGRYEITAHSGDVRFTPAGATGFALTARSFNGDVSASMALQNESRSRRQSLSGKVGDGSATVTLKTFSGDITVGTKKR